MTSSNDPAIAKLCQAIRAGKLSRESLERIASAIQRRTGGGPRTDAYTPGPGLADTNTEAMRAQDRETQAIVERFLRNGCDAADAAEVVRLSRVYDDLRSRGRTRHTRERFVEVLMQSRAQRN